MSCIVEFYERESLHWHFDRRQNNSLCLFFTGTETKVKSCLLEDACRILLGCDGGINRADVEIQLELKDYAAELKVFCL